MKHRTLSTALLLGTALLSANVLAATHKIEIPVRELELPIDNAGTTAPMWTYGGTIPGPLVRVKEGDVVDFTLINEAGNKNSHSMDFHAGRLDVLTDFEAIKPGQKKQFSFKAEYPGVWIYHCGADSMAELTRCQPLLMPQCDSWPHSPSWTLHSVMPIGPSIAVTTSARLISLAGRDRSVGYGRSVGR